MLRKILAIAWTRFYITYTDRGALLMMILAPVAISTIIALAFSNVGSDITIETSQLVVINQDQGAEANGRAVNSGETYEEILVRNIPAELQSFVKGESQSDIEAARQAVRDGDLEGVLIIPADFSSQVLAGQGEIELYYNPGNQIQATVLMSIIEQITANLNTGRVGEDVFVGIPDGYFIRKGAGDVEKISAAAEESLTQLYSGGVPATVTLSSVNVTGERTEFDALQYFAPSMAIFFMTFAMAAGAKSILEDQHNWTLQRIMTTATPRWAYLMGKLLGTFGSGLLQMLILIVVTPLVAIVLGRDAGVWGDNYLGMALITVLVVAAAAGLGLLIAAISRTAQSADNIASAVLVLLGILSGTFINVDGIAGLNTISRLTFNYWAISGYTDLAANNASLTDILPNLAALLLMALGFFGIALWQFSRRLDI